MLDRPGLGASSATTKITTTSKAVATTTPQPAEGVGGDHTDQGGGHQGAHLEGEEHHGQDACRCAATRRSKVAAPRRPSSTRAWALTFDVRVMAVSDRASTPVAAISTTTTTTKRSRRPSRHRSGRADSTGRAAITSPALLRLVRGPVVAGQQVALLGLHDLGLVGILVVQPEQVQQAVDDQQGDLVVVGAGVLGGVAVGDRRADDHVAEQGRHLLWLGAEARPGATRIRRTAAVGRLLVDREGQHVGRAVLAEEPGVEIGDGALVDEEQRHLGLPAHPLVGQHGLGQLDPAQGVDRMGRLFVGREDRQRPRVPRLPGVRPARRPARPEFDATATARCRRPTSTATGRPDGLRRPPRRR